MRVLMTKEEIKALYPECGEDYEAYANAGARHAVEEVERRARMAPFGLKQVDWGLCIKSMDWERIKKQAGVEKQVDQILRSGFWNLGSIEGTLDALNLHGRNPVFTIWDRVSRAPVKCLFPGDSIWKERVKTLLERRVLVVGRVNYFTNGYPRCITNIVRVEDMTPNTTLPKAEFGSIPSPDIVENPSAFLRAVRGERG